MNAQLQADQQGAHAEAPRFELDTGHHHSRRAEIAMGLAKRRRSYKPLALIILAVAVVCALALI